MENVMEITQEHISSIEHAPNLISRNVNSITGSILLICTYTPSIDLEFVAGLSRGRDVYTFCPELCHLDVLGLKLTTVFRLGRVTDVTVVTKDGSPHSMQIPLMMQEAAENAGFDKDRIAYYALEGGRAHTINDLTIRKARHYSEIETLMPYAKLRKVAEILRSPGGCPNDQKETFDSILDHFREEVEEIAEAVRSKDYDNLQEEIGDVLFNVFLIADVARSQGLFNIDDVTAAVAQKMVDKHDFVFENRKWKY